MKKFIFVGACLLTNSGCGTAAPIVMDVIKFADIALKALCDDVLEPIPNEPDYVMVTCHTIDKYAVSASSKPSSVTFKVKMKKPNATLISPSASSSVK